MIKKQRRHAKLCQRWDDDSVLALAMAFRASFLSSDFWSPALHLFPFLLLSLALRSPGAGSVGLMLDSSPYRALRSDF